MKRKYILFAVLPVLAAVFSSCLRLSPTAFNLDTQRFQTFFHEDAESHCGKKTACYDGRIYYLSDESGTQGIHSMRPDGSGVKLVFPAEDIRSLQITEQFFLYAGFEKNVEELNLTYRSFTGFRRKNTERNSAALQNAVGEEAAVLLPVLPEWNIWDVRLTEDGLLIFRINAPDYTDGAPVLKTELVRAADGRIIWQVENGETLRFPVERIVIDGEEYPFLLTQVGTIRLAGNGCTRTCISKYGICYDEWMQNADIFGSSGERLLTQEPLFRPDYDRPEEKWQLCRMTERGVYLLQSGCRLLYCDRATGETETVAEIPKQDRAYATFESGGGFRLLTESPNSHSLFAFLKRDCGQALYGIDVEGKEQKELLRLPQSAAFVYLDETRAIAAKGKKLLFYDLTGEQAEQTGTMELATRIVDRRNKVECAGGWLFLYRFNDKTMRDELVEKVRIG